ncbi:MAG: SDR family NAD(P)-dependent oxidoreductase [Candidatus Latescibacterota bacterium]
MRLKDKVAVVTGGGQGIGRGIALIFAQEGAKLVIAARSAEKLERVRTELVELGAEVLAVATDVGVRAQMEHLFAATEERFGRLDVLVNNAGVGLGVPVDQVKDEDWDRLINTNLRGMHLGCHLAVPMMKRVGQGSIVNISSVHGVEGSPGNTVYATTKAGIIGGTRALAAELAPHYIRVNVISPGAIYLGGERGYEPPAGLKPEVHEEFRQRFGDHNRIGHRYFQPLELVGEPVDIAYLAVYLASDESRFVTGQEITVDGGLTTYMAQFPRDDLRAKRDQAQAELREFLQSHREQGG